MPIVLLAALGLWLAARSNLEAPYVSYRGERLPATEAGRYVCHDLALPEIRCFDSVEELIRDLDLRFPGHADRFRRLWLATWPPQLIPEPANPRP
ncbi:MAG: hypothetical protein KatS3mg065_0662 [Chloroflexota bacterium]|nr:MAG: hypothetical protein KatS3mg065_0662 [Chloroflexota bacterium]